MPVRLALAAGLALIITLGLGPFVIPVLKKLKFGQTVRNEGPRRHLQKAGTPTMGGLIFLAGVMAGALIAAERTVSPEMGILVGATLCYGLIGFIDDYIKIVLHRSLGLRAYQKLIGQFAVTFVLLLISVYCLGRGTDVAIPFTSLRWELGFFYYILVSLIVVGMVNAVNLTDGLDGLAAGSVFIAGGGYLVIALLAVGQEAGVAALPHRTEPAVFAAAIMGGTLGFLWFNRYPARVFMGDTGALALGGALVSMAVLTKSELVLVILGGLFALEALAVMIQVFFYQTTGKRIFRMSPLHHHFELGGWSEWKVVKVFWGAALVCAVLGIISFLPTLR